MPKNESRVKPEFLSVDEAQLLTGRSRWSWRRDAYSGRIASAKVGRRLLIPLSEIRRLLNEGMRPAAKLGTASRGSQ
jgi:hypothetical protein